MYKLTMISDPASNPTEICGACGVVFEAAQAHGATPWEMIVGADHALCRECGERLCPELAKRMNRHVAVILDRELLLNLSQRAMQDIFRAADAHADEIDTELERLYGHRHGSGR